MFSKTHELMIESIFALRSWCKDNLPTENSFIAYDLILVLAINNYAKNNISIKELFASVPHSYTAVRGHYLRFVNDGWVEHYLDESDKRIKYVRPTAKLVKTMNDYAAAAHKILMKIWIGFGGEGGTDWQTQIDHYTLYLYGFQIVTWVENMSWMYARVLFI